ncbi:MAG: tRNA (adenosine(37)-N6)-threonylcarbamoyltransferase complex dimerization subunit type 1 TsaB [Clostridiaceae bacterium]|nr:tRNA (adenosine(37)-N6)-threonylcarbamoyltransferase complex dimerization subunit type 1 TsaB [Clostridiaceae bacterium]
MKILGIDSSAKSASAAITDADKILGCFYTNTGLTHSQTLMPMIESLLKYSNTSLDDIDLIAVNKGPGSFTGVRIGVAAAKGLADVKNIPVCGTSTLESMAYNLVDTDCIACCVMDARCNQVYNAIFDITDGKITRLTPDNADSIENVTEEIKKYKKIKFFVGDGAEICYNKLYGDSDIRIAAPSDRFQSAVGVCFCAMNASRDQYIDSALLVPEYLRLPQAERELNKKLSKGV